MNSSQLSEHGNLVMELKYCERCGGLWLRQRGDEESYCANCRAAMAAWPQMGRRPERRRTCRARIPAGVKGKDSQAAVSGPFVIETLCGVAELGTPDMYSSPTAPEVTV